MTTCPFSLTTLEATSRKELLVAIKKELSEILVGNDLKTSWHVMDMKVSFCEPGSDASVYVRLGIDNPSGIIFFDDLPKVEKTIRELIKGADNFTLGSGTLYKPRVGFVV